MKNFQYINNLINNLILFLICYVLILVFYGSIGNYILGQITYVRNQLLHPSNEAKFWLFFYGLCKLSEIWEVK